MSNEKTVTLTESELEDVMTNSIKRAFTEMGIDTGNPQEQQRDFAHLRKWRISVDRVSSTGLATAAAVVVTGILGALWLGLSTLLQTPR